VKRFGGRSVIDLPAKLEVRNQKGVLPSSIVRDNCQQTLKGKVIG